MKYLSRSVIIFLISAFCLGNLYKISFFSPDIHATLLDLVIFTSTLTVILVNPRGYLGNFKTYGVLVRPFMLFLAVASVSLVISLPRFGIQAFFVGSLYWLRFAFYGGYFLVLKTLLSVKDLRTLFWGLGGIIMATCLTQYIFFPDVRHLQIAEWDPHYFRVVGTLLDPGFTSIILVFLLIYGYFHPVKNSILNKLIIFIGYLCFALTYSRTGFIALFAASAFYSRTIKSWRFMLITSIVLISTLLILPRAPGGEGVKLERTSSIKARLINWQNSASIFVKNPVLGVGFNTYRYAQKQAGFLDPSKWLKSHAGAGADSSLLFIAATTGIIGLIFFIRYLNSIWKISSGNLCLRASLVALFFHSFFLNSLFYPFVLIWISLLLAAVKNPESKADR